MPYIGFGLHLVIALFFAVHAIRSGQSLFWLFILFSFPLLGSAVYFLAVYLPNSRLQYGAQKVVAKAAKALDPSRALREARAAFDFTPTAQNQMRLAEALLDDGLAEEAANNYEACLKGPFSTDLEIRFGAARAYYACQKFQEAIEQLNFVRAQDAQFRPEQVSLLFARAFEGAGRRQDAKNEFESAFSRFGSFDVKAEYLIWALSAQEHETAARLQVEVQRATERWSRHTKELNRPLIRRLEAAYQLARQAA
jgi:hypothetical protein